MMRTLTHEPLAFAFAALLLVAIVAAFTVWVTLRVQTRSGRARPSGAGTEQPSMPLGAAGPGVVNLVSTTPGPDTKTRPSAMGGGKSAGSASAQDLGERDAKAEGLAGPEAADMAPEGAPAALSGATPREFCATCGKWQPGPHMDWCYRFSPLNAAAANVRDSLADHIDTAAALLSPASPVERDGEFAEQVERWLYAANAYCINCGTLIEDCHYGAERPLWQHIASKFVGCPDGGLFAAPRPSVVPGRSES